MAYPDGTNCLGCTTRKKLDQPCATCGGDWPSARSTSSPHQSLGQHTPSFGYASTTTSISPRSLVTTPVLYDPEDAGNGIQFVHPTPFGSASVPSAQIEEPGSFIQSIHPSYPTSDHDLAFPGGLNAMISYDSVEVSHSSKKGRKTPSSPGGVAPHRARGRLTSAQASLFDALLSLARPEDDPETLERGQSPPQSSETDGYHPPLDEPEPNLLENPQDVADILFAPLNLDHRVTSNWIPFVLQSYALWMSRFLFEPVRIIPIAREYVYTGYATGPESRWRMTMTSHIVRAMIAGEAYNPGDLLLAHTLQDAMRQGWHSLNSHHEPDPDLDRQLALRSLDSVYELITMQVKLTPLASLMTTLRLAAPIFRRACPDPPDDLVDLPALLVTTNISLQSYAMFDILLSALTSRPMFFRYNITITPQIESILHDERVPGLRWLYGVPDPLLVTFARINILLEDFGAFVEPRIIHELETEILGFRSIVGVSSDPTHTVGRLVVQECWRQTALIYLYMALCGANSRDARIIKAHDQFADVLQSVRPARNPDSFLILPMIMFGAATSDPNLRSVVRKRMLALPDCSRPGTVGNDVVRILDDLWSLGRPVVLSDLRLACLRVVGM